MSESPGDYRALLSSAVGKLTDGELRALCKKVLLEYIGGEEFRSLIREAAGGEEEKPAGAPQ